METEAKTGTETEKDRQRDVNRDNRDIGTETEIQRGTETWRDIEGRRHGVT